MITLTIHDREALSLLAVVEHIEDFYPSMPADQMRRIAAQLRCALLLCGCAKEPNP